MDSTHMVDTIIVGITRRGITSNKIRESSQAVGLVQRLQSDK